MSFTILLSLFLTVAILAPSVITLLDIEGSTTLVIDFNEEENNLEGKKDFFFYKWTDAITFLSTLKTYCSTSYLKPTYTNSLEIFLPPPKHIA